MLIEGKFIVKVPIQKAWDNLFKPETLASCIPGCEKMEIIDERTYDTIVSAKVGSISVRFKFITTLTEIDSPHHFKAIGKGEEMSKAGTFRQETVVDLKEVSGEEAEVSYRSDVTIVGRLATFGDRVMRAKAKEVEEKFTQALNKQLSGENAAVSKLKVSTVEVLTAFLAILWGRITSFFRARYR